MEKFEMYLKSMYCETTCVVMVKDGVKTVLSDDYIQKSRRDIELVYFDDLERKGYLTLYAEMDSPYVEDDLIKYAINNQDLELWDDEHLEMFKLGKCYYTDIVTYDRFIGEDAHGNTFCPKAISLEIVRRCDECREWYSDDEMTETSHGYVCQDCIEERYVYCEICGCYERETEAHYDDHNDYYVCDDCFQRYYDYCWYTKEYYPIDDLVSVRTSYNDYMQCFREYAMDNLPYCDECGDYIDPYFYNYDRDCCIACEPEDIIRNYQHTRYNLDFFGNSPWYVGTELEVSAPESVANRCEYECASKIVDELFEHDSIVLKRDGSINGGGYRGFEIVTMPYSLDYINNNRYRFNDMLSMLSANGYTSHNNGMCGLHFHISREMFGSDEDEINDNIAKVVYFYNEHYDEIVKVSRRSISAAREWADSYNGDGDSLDCYNNLADNKDKIKNVVKDDKYKTRYKAVNLTNEHTVEFRIMRGTLNIDSFWACFDFTLKIAMNSLKISWDQIDDLNLWFKDIEDNTKTYIKKRNAFNSVELI